MSDERLYGTSTLVGSNGGGWQAMTGNRFGHLYVADTYEAMALGGYVFVANAGTVTTPVTFGAGTIDTTEPDFDLLVPATKLVIPLSIEVKIEAFGTDAIFELMASVGVGGTQGTDTDLTVKNMRSDAPATTGCTVGAASNADAVYMTSNVFEFWRDGIAKVATVGTGDDDSNRGFETFRWSRKEMGTGPVMAGSSRLNVFAAGQATTGFITVTWAEFTLADSLG